MKHGTLKANKAHIMQMPQVHCVSVDLDGTGNKPYMCICFVCLFLFFFGGGAYLRHLVFCRHIGMTPRSIITLGYTYLLGKPMFTCGLYI